MRTYRTKGYAYFDVEVMANDETEALKIGKQQTEETLYKTDVNFTNIKMTRAVDSTTAQKVRRI